MPVATPRPRRTATSPWVVLGLRVHSEIHSELKMAADREGYSMEVILNRALCQKFRRPDLKNLTPPRKARPAATP